MEGLLEESKRRLLLPTMGARRKLVIVMNIVYVISTIFFLTSERIAEGKFVPQVYLLYYIYVPAIILNIGSLLYNLSVLGKAELWQNMPEIKIMFYDKIAAWTSMAAIMIMSTANMLGIGNPSQDAIFTDFALGHALILVVVLVVGRKGATIWFVIVLGILLYRSFDLGFDYQYHYMTSSEVVKYENALKNNEKWAIERQDVLNQSGLNPPKVSRYMNIWLIFIVVSYLTAYFFSGITLDLIKEVRPVINNIEEVVEEGSKLKNELEQRRNEAIKAAHRISRTEETLKKIEEELHKLSFEQRSAFQPITRVIKEELQKEINRDYRVFELSFDLTQNGHFEKLQKKYPQLTPNEMKLLGYFKLNMSNKDIADLMGIKSDSIRQSRSRIKKKLGLTSENWMEELLNGI
ncbi:hypothetical protein C900_04693 [Fulvivirga imtechensis AK7]|uniref:HTH luxR-type domain-containing protein n=1 Tax=Fulvivirga imtechensis AK7 TaxID=1237149 RepID=L8JLA0_9BACT|nr:LuxR C-terminal-related transcriptional regulator [Fulvivirga imtechensis]ELR69716.1 hypothetical protein C900_04693 [Fulvivirga imtechensis AK7]